MTKRRVHFVLSTHWDREWREPFQALRYDLVRLLDRVLVGLEKGGLEGPFTTDGQSIILEDYLEIRREKRAQIEEFARQGKLMIGPWYVMPDEFTVSGESLIRNLCLGRDVARSLGAEPSRAGFVCDMFGHNSQMPQIFAGFGISGAFLWRGLNTVEKRNLIWRGADGTALPCLRFGKQGYGSYAYQVRHADDIERTFDPARASGDLEGFLATEAEKSDIDALLLFDGCDHQEWDQEAYAFLVECMHQDDPHYRIVHTSLDAFLEEMLSQIERIDTIVEGELRDPGRYPLEMDQQWVIPGVLSSRARMKQANAKCETLLCHWAEPFSAFAHFTLDAEHPQSFLDLSWRWLIQNHAHDSIGGCSIDQVHRDMAYRFDQSRLISEKLTKEATHRLAASTGRDLSDGDLRVVLFNPLPRPIKQIAELTLQIPSHWPTFNEFFGFEAKPAFRIYDADDQEVPYQRLNQAMDRVKSRIRQTKFPERYVTHDVKVALPLSIPAMGYTSLRVRPGQPGQPTRHPEGPGLATSDCSMANEHLSVEVASNGTLTIRDKKTHQVYRNLLIFEDSADIGDGWYHGVAVNDQVFASTASKSQIALVHNGPMLTTFRVRTALSTPRRFQFDTMTRSEEFVEVLLDSLISLRPGQAYVDVHTTVANIAEDHRLRVLFPTNTDAETYLSDSPFDVVVRPIPLRSDNHDYRELEVETKPQQSWTAVHDANRGLAVVSAGLLESAVRDRLDRAIALTLFRGTRRTIFTDGEPDGQLQGKLEFDYWIVPLAGTPDRTDLCEMGQRIAAGLRDVQLRPKDLPIYRARRTLPPKAGFLCLEGPPVVTSVRQAGECLEVRMFNPRKDPISGYLDFGEWPSEGASPPQVHYVNFEGQRYNQRQACMVNGKVELTLEPKQIITVCLTWQKQEEL
jgi:hypothetical protein